MSVQQTLSPRVRAILKSHHRLLNPTVDSLSEQSKAQLEILLALSQLLRRVWEWKKSFHQWYDHSSKVYIASLGFTRWLEQGENIDHNAVRNTLKTMRNWQDDIFNRTQNYHSKPFSKVSIKSSLSNGSNFVLFPFCSSYSLISSEKCSLIVTGDSTQKLYNV